MDSLVVAAAALALIALAYWYSHRTPAVVAPKYTQTVTGMWTPEPGNVYTCPASSSHTAYCIVPTEATAQTLCSGDPKCLGYLYYSDTPTFGDRKSVV